MHAHWHGHSDLRTQCNCTGESVSLLSLGSLKALHFRDEIASLEDAPARREQRSTPIRNFVLVIWSLHGGVLVLIIHNNNLHIDRNQMTGYQKCMDCKSSYETTHRWANWEGRSPHPLSSCLLGVPNLLRKLAGCHVVLHCSISTHQHRTTYNSLQQASKT